MVELKRFCSRTHQGPYLQINEDTFEMDIENGLFMVLDGFGGAGIGDAILKEITQNIKKFYTRVSDDPDSTLPFFYSHKYLLEGNALINSFYYTHQQLKKKNSQKDINFKAGASAAAMALSEHLATLCMVGNCRGYLFRDSQLIKIISEENLALSSFPSVPLHFRTAPTSALGLFEDIHIQTMELRILPGDMVILLTDGVYAFVTDQDLFDILTSSGEGLQYKINLIFDKANQLGNMDNQTTMLLEF